MNYEETKKPNTSTVALAIIFCLIVIRWFSGNEALDAPFGCVILGAGGSATWTVGRWLWHRYVPRQAAENFR